MTVIVAEEMASANLEEIFRHLQPEKYPCVEFLICSGSDDSLLDAVPDSQNVRIIHAQSDSRIPLLWRDGIRAAQADKVALTTAHCIPSQDWIKQLLACPLEGGQVAVGGAIENIENDTVIGRVIYLLRYVRYTRSRPSGRADDLAADNALYRKADILAHEDLLEAGFWEPSFHQRFLAEGKSMAFDNNLVVVHRNCYSAKQFIQQRYSHGVEFGMARAKTMSTPKRLTMIALSPLIPLVFTRKIIAAARRDKQFNLGLNRDMFWLLVFVLAWSMGETVGYVKRQASQS
ncbi:glycosyltransferase [Marinobacter sp. SS8-8]|uniref:glycosyltransferase n=1 Tax=Marinobacter sp. SS8-8 TaxID=3050452 RepID=UPI0026DF4463|nr:glycosyltransferase [Marinobacter sp. SS8-8]